MDKLKTLPPRRYRSQLVVSERRPLFLWGIFGAVAAIFSIDPAPGWAGFSPDLTAMLPVKVKVPRLESYACYGTVEPW